MQNILEIKNLCKYFGNNKANDDINLDIYKGEVHAIVGENGAGKSTLMNTIYGLYQPDFGTILLNNKVTHFTGPRDALNAGIGMVHQHFMLIPPMTVLNNIIVGNEPIKKLIIDEKEARAKVLKISKDYHLDIDLDQKVSEISVGMKQRVEIIKAIYRGAEILILDEPSAVLTPQEIDKLFEIIKTLKEQGKTILFITHKLDEVKKVSDRVTVLRRGKLVKTLNTCDLSSDDLAKLMVGRELSLSGINKKIIKNDDVILKVNNIKLVGDNSRMILNDVSFELKAGEVLGVAGVDGNGQIELVEVISGIKKASKGEISLNGERIEKQNVKKIRDKGMSFIPEDRQKQGLILDYSIQDNLILGAHNDSKFSKHGWLLFNNIEENAKEKIEKYDIRPTNQMINARNLSGGNQQKVVLAREIDRECNLIIAVQPTRGLDVGAIEFIHKTIIDARNNNKAILLISFELDEILSLSDKIAVMRKGKIVEIINQKDATKEGLGILMLSGKDAEERSVK